MATTTISPNFRLTIPREIREKLHLSPGQKVTILAKGGIIYCFPVQPLESLRGFLKGMGRDAKENEER